MIHRPQIKICGLTSPDEAVQCAELGADAIGLVFFRKSPRNLSVASAADISRSLPEETSVVGVFVNETYDIIMNRVEACGLTAVQLHGNESPELVDQLLSHHLSVIKVLYIRSEPDITRADSYRSTAFLVECAKGVLPGGNAMAWNWEEATSLSSKKPIIIAGGLTPETVGTAINACKPDAVDISSGVEREPGKKDITKVKEFIRAVSACKIDKQFRRSF